MKPLVVLPTYEEAINIAKILRAVRAALPEGEVLVVDDGSPDGTADLAEQVGAEVGAVHVLRRAGKSGLGSAYRAGFAWGLARGFDVLIEMDADFSHDPADLPRLLAALVDGVEVVIGSRYVAGGSTPGWSWSRRAISRVGNIYASTVLRLDVADLTAGFRAYAGTLLRRIDLETIRAEGYGFQVEMTLAATDAGGVIAEIPIRFVDREEGQSKMSSAIVVEALVLVAWWGLRRLGGSRRGGAPARMLDPSASETPPTTSVGPTTHGTETAAGEG